MRLKEALGVPAIGGLFGVKVYAGHKYLEHRQRVKRRKMGAGLSAREFAKLPRHRQRNIIAYRRSRQRELEGAYAAGRKRKWQ